MPPPLLSDAYAVAQRAAASDLHARLLGTDATTPAAPWQVPTVAALTAFLQAAQTCAPPHTLLLHAPATTSLLALLTRAVASLSTPPTQLTLHGVLHASAPAAWRALAAQLCPEVPPPTSVPECQHAVQEALDALRAARQPLLLVLRDLPLLAAPDPLAQGVLYTLLSLARDPTLSVAVLAVSPAADAADLLEKRVKSRFAAREFVVRAPRDPTEVIGFIRQAAGALDSGAPPDTASVSRRAFERRVADFSATAIALADDPALPPLFTRAMARCRAPEPLLLAVHAVLYTSFDTVVEASVKARVKGALRTMEERLVPQDALCEMLRALPAAEIGLVAALLRRQRRGGPVVFGDVWREYGGLAGGGGEIVAWEVAQKAWERLVECGLVVRGGHAPRHMRWVKLGVGDGIVEGAVRDHKGVGTVVKRWALARGTA